ncbi:MAG: efflux RND transporter periplasmic adaptor subunit [Bacteroidota bacterium]
MRNRLTAALMIVLATACSQESREAKKEQLKALKKEQAELRKKIAQLEAEISANDTLRNSKEGKLIATTVMKADSFYHYVEVQGRIEGDEDVTIGAESMGNVTAVYVKTGDQVYKGKTLARMDDRVVRQGYNEVKSQLDLAEQMYRRQENLWQQRIGTEMQFLQAKTNKEALEKRLAGVSQQMSMSVIKSPINGTVDQVMIKSGQSLAPGMPVMRIVNQRNMKVTGEVAESYISSIKTGNPVILKFPDINKEIPSRLDYAGSAINRLNRTFNVEVRMNEKHEELKPNMITILKIVDYTNPSAFTLPVASIQKSGDGEYVFVAEKAGKKLIAKRRKVVSGVTYNGNTEIKEGVSEGDEVITTGYQSIMEGDIISK